MKARSKTTGEIVEVINLYDDGTALTIDGYTYKISNLDFFEDFEDAEWKEVRIQTAIAAMQTFCKDINIGYEKASEMAVKQANALVNELKKN